MSGKKIILIVSFVLLLVGIPAAVYMLQQQQTTQQQAQKATILAFEPTSTAGNPIAKNVGDDVVLDIMVDPGTNVVSSINVEIQYDQDKLATASANGFVINSSVFSSVLVGPVYTPGKIVANLAISDPTKAIQSKTKAVTITFKALATTATGTPTQITYTVNSRATSRGPNDQALENVLSSTLPAFITIAQATAPTATPTTATEEEEPTATLTPTTGPTVTPGGPTETPTATDSANPTNAVPICQALTVDQSTGQAPFAVSFTANGNDSDDVISKATFNFGDGQVSDVTTGGGLETASVNVQASHTYESSGTFQATAILSDTFNGISNTANCSQTISVTASGTATLVPTVGATGTSDVLFGIGFVSILFIIGGGLLFLIL